jgi:hypothetical protein
MFYYTPLSNLFDNEWIVGTEMASSLSRVHEVND